MEGGNTGRRNWEERREGKETVVNWAGKKVN